MEKLAPGAYDLLITKALREALAELPQHLTFKDASLTATDAVDYLARELSKRIEPVLSRLANDTENENRPAFLNFINDLLARIDGPNPAELSLLTSVHEKLGTPAIPPVLPMSQSALVTNDQGLNLSQILRSELESADRVDMICPFIGNQGLNLILGQLQRFGPKLRIITTTYLGGTHLKALVRLAETGAQIKIVYESTNQKTALHAKAWIFHRNSGFSTATIGSSNLSQKALVDGLEWNVRVGAIDAPQVLKELEVTFDRLWADPIYEPFDPKRDSERVRIALSEQAHESQTLYGS